MHLRAILLCSFLLSLFIPGCDGPARGTIPSAQAAPGPARSRAVKPRLVVLVVVDQLPSWWFKDKSRHFTRGLARLLREGVYYPEAEYPYAVTFTAAGHAALGTGAPPSVTGVADNERWVPSNGNGEELPAASDSAHAVHILAGSPKKQPKDGRSSQALREEGVADVLERATRKAARTVAISIKDRSAIFVGGRRPDLAVWYDESQPAMTTSAYYADAPPAWLRALVQQDQVERYRDYVWSLLPGLDHGKITGSKDREPGDTVSAEGLYNAFPHRLADSSNWAKDLQSTPAGDLLVFETARAAIDALDLGKDQVPDFLALSFSAPDMVGHNWGPDSWERLDILARFDRELGRFLLELDQRFGPQGYALVLTSDHGIAPVVEFSKKYAKGKEVYRYHRDDIERIAEAFLDGLLGQGPGDWIPFVSDNSVFISPQLPLADPRRAQAAAKLVQHLRTLPGIQFVEQTELLRKNDCEKHPKDSIERLVCYSLVPRGNAMELDPAGDIYFAAKDGTVISKYDQGTNHGSPNDYDRIVPILVYAPGDPRWAKPRKEETRVNTLQVAPTLAALLGVSSPPAAKEPPLP
jgi:Type I phosphodiesterase / nucleotide pyrophosphatase